MSIVLPSELQACPPEVLEAYVGSRLKQFCTAFADKLAPDTSAADVERIYSLTQSSFSATTAGEPDVKYNLRFSHICRWLGCKRKECLLCKNNPNKRCSDGDNFDECYADNQTLRSKCEAEIYIELINTATGQPAMLPGVEIVVSVIDGDSYSDTAATNLARVRELLRSDEGTVLLSTNLANSKADPDGRFYLRPLDGKVRLPDLCITDKNDTFHMGTATFGCFRLMARAVRRSAGSAGLVDGIPTCLSGKFVVKTQRALNDYRKCDYPHANEDVTKLKHIGSITAQRLREIQQHLDVPFTCIDTVEHMKQLLQYADQNRHVENRLLELLNMKGKHKHKYDFLREVLAERVVYDDAVHRAWFADETSGLLFACKQAQVHLERPIGLLQRVPSAGSTRLLLTTINSLDAPTTERLRAWRQTAEAAWQAPGHSGWSLVQEPLEMVGSAGNTSIIINSGGSMNLHSSMSMSMSGGAGGVGAADGYDSPQAIARRGSIQMAEAAAQRSRRSSAVAYPSDAQAQAQAQAQLIHAHQQQQQLAAQHAAQGQGQGLGGASSAEMLLLQRLQAMQAVQAAQAAQAMHAQQAAHAMQAVQAMQAAQAYQCSMPGMLATSNHARGSGDMSGSGYLPGAPQSSSSTPAGMQSRSPRYRRMSADASGVRQSMPPPSMPHMSAGMQGDGSMDLGSKRGRASAPGAPLLGYAGMGVEMQQPHHDAPEPAELTAHPRHMLYHFESRGRHTPRSRPGNAVDAPGVLGSLLETSHLDDYLAGDAFEFPAPPDNVAAAVDALVADAGGGGGDGDGGPRMQHVSSDGGLTGQLQNALFLGDNAMQQQQQQQPSYQQQALQQHQQQQGYQQHQAYQQQQQQQQLLHYQQQAQHMGGQEGQGAGNGMLQLLPPGNDELHLDMAGLGFPGLGDLPLDSPAAAGTRELKHCESDSFKRFLQSGLPFGDGMPDGL